MIGKIMILAASFLPIWKDDMTDRGLNIWQYIIMAAKREHIPVEEAIENYRRHN